MAHANDNCALPRSKSEAKTSGAIKFFTGLPCQQGHIAPRYTVNSSCISCTYESKLKRKNSDPEKWKELLKAERERSFARDPSRRRKHTREFMRKWRAANPELSAKMMRAWRRENPEKAKQHDANNSARRRMAVGKHTANDVKLLLKLQKYKCASCGKSVRKSHHVDHIMPIALGGTNWPSNLQILCPKCNQQKHAKHPIDWAREKGRLV